MARRQVFQGDQVKLSADLKAFSSRLGHDFKATELLVEALTHSSLSSQTRPDNQRLEFLGDRVLGLVISEALLSVDPNASEGVLAPRYNSLVRKETCAEIALSVDLGAALKLGRSEMMSGGRRKQALLGDAMEAVIAAVYLDAGFQAARAMVLSLWGRRIADAKEDARDAKTALQEWAQARGQKPPDYAEVGRTGPDHAPLFTVKAALESGEAATATAASKRLAQQEAAAELLDRLETEND